MDWTVVAVVLAALVGVGLVGAVVAWRFHRNVMTNYLGVVARIFQEKPLFQIPYGQPQPDAEETLIPAEGVDGLRGCYLKALAPGPRKGVILFGLEFGSNRWSCVPYCGFLREAGYDVFACETRGQGQTKTINGYDPLQWVTEFEVADYRAILGYLKGRTDADPRGVGLFGLSKGGSAGLLVAAEDPFVRCCVTDGAFGTLTTMIPYMSQWVMIYTKRKWFARWLPPWYLRIVAKDTLRQVEVERKVKYPSLAAAMGRISPRPLFMIHGGADTYIKPDMARRLFDEARAPKELWVVEKAKHNQAFHLAAEEYKRRVREFFDRHLAGAAP